MTQISLSNSSSKRISIFIEEKFKAVDKYASTLLDFS